MRDWFDRFLHVIFGVLLIMSFLFFQRYYQEKKQRQERILNAPRPSFLDKDKVL